MADQAGTVRNGALATSGDGRPIGFVVNSFEGGKSYSLAPFADVLSHHGLDIPPLAYVEREAKRYRDGRS